MQSIIVSHGSRVARQNKIALLIKDKLGTDIENPKLKLETYQVLKDDDKKFISIDQVRKVIEFINIKPSHYLYKLILVNDSQLMTSESQNAFLKTLEEPPEHSLIILEADHYKNLLRTVQSRCEIILVQDQATNKSFIVGNEFEVLTAEKMIALLSSDDGFKVDWVSANKENFKNAQFLETFFNSLELVLRDLILVQNKVDLEITDNLLLSTYKELVENKQIDWLKTMRQFNAIKRNIQKSNVNVAMNIEFFLFNLHNN